MPIKDLHAAKFDEGTLVKLELFQDYLKEWLPVFIHSQHQSPINIIDFFAGSGTDCDGTAGSPLRIFDIIEEYLDAIINKNLSINVILNDFDEEKCTKLKAAVNTRLDENQQLKDAINVSFRNDDFGKLFSELAPVLKNESNLIFIDQNGIRHVSQDVLATLDSFTRSDFLFYISSSYFIRFDFKNHFPDLKDSIDLNKPANIHREIAEYYRKKLPKDSATKLYPFTIKKAGGYYGLVFGSQHCRGVEKFLSICWKKNGTNGEANFDIDEEYKLKQRTLFGPPRVTKLNKFRTDLMNFVLENGEVTNGEVLEFTLARGFESKQAKEVLRKMRDDKQIEHFSHAKIGCEQVYKNNYIVKFKKR